MRTRDTVARRSGLAPGRCAARYTPNVPTVVASDRSSSFCHPAAIRSATPHAETLYSVPAHSWTATPSASETHRWRSPRMRAGASRNHAKESRDAIIARAPRARVPRRLIRGSCARNAKIGTRPSSGNFRSQAYSAPQPRARVSLAGRRTFAKSGLEFDSEPLGSCFSFQEESSGSFKPPACERGRAFLARDQGWSRGARRASLGCRDGGARREGHDPDNPGGSQGQGTRARITTIMFNKWRHADGF